MCIRDRCRALCENTGYDEVSLSSLSSSYYTQIVPLLTKLNEWSKDEKVSISLPSLRVDGFTDDIMNKIKTVPNHKNCHETEYVKELDKLVD